MQNNTSKPAADALWRTVALAVAPHSPTQGYPAFRRASICVPQKARISPVLAIPGGLPGRLVPLDALQMLSIGDASRGI